jgi:CTP:molybdopterin cytidylyltransferase MocA
VLVIDDRPEFAQSRTVSRRRWKLAAGRSPANLIAVPLGQDVYVVVVTRGHRDDAAALAACIDKPLAYLGMIGSRSKVRKIRDEFLRSGRASAAEFDRVYAPIGLDLGAVTVPEIAVSIVAQLIAVRRQGTARGCESLRRESWMICAIVLAAGRSRRMGIQKLLLPIAGRPLICHTLDAVLASSVDQVTVVAGSERQSLAEALANRPVGWAINDAADSEMIDSIRCGLTALPPQCEAALVVLGDQPGIPSEVIDQLIVAFRKQHAGLVVPVYGGRRGHPLLIAARYHAEIMEHYADQGVRGLLQTHAQQVVEIAVASPGILDDIDTPDDYQRVIAGMNGTVVERGRQHSSLGVLPNDDHDVRIT